MKADRFLEEKGLDFETVTQNEPTLDCDDAARERGVDTSQIAKSLIVEKDGGEVHCIIPGDRALSAGKFGEHRLVDPERSKEITGQKSGTVHPFSSSLPHFVDRRLLEEDRISFTTGNSQKGVIIDADRFREALKESEFEFSISDYVENTAEDIRELEKLGLKEDQARFIASSSLQPTLKSLKEDFELQMIVDILKEFRRHDLEVEEKILKKTLSRADNETHMQKLVESYAKTSELPEKKEFSLKETVNGVIEENPDAVEDFKEGKDSALNYLLGQVMKATNGQADGGKARAALRRELDG